MQQTATDHAQTNPLQHVIEVNLSSKRMFRRAADQVAQKTNDLHMAGMLRTIALQRGQQARELTDFTTTYMPKEVTPPTEVDELRVGAALVREAVTEEDLDEEEMEVVLNGAVAAEAGLEAAYRRAIQSYELPDLVGMLNRHLRNASTQRHRIDNRLEDLN